MAPTKAKKVAPRTNAKRTTRHGQTNTGSTDRALGSRTVLDDVDGLETPAGSLTQHVENLDSDQITADLTRENAAMKGQWRGS